VTEAGRPAASSGAATSASAAASSGAATPPRAAAAASDGGPGGRLAGLVAIVIAFATLIAALAGLLQADTANKSGDLRDQAEQLSLEALSGSQAAQERAQVGLETFQLYLEQRTQAGNAIVAGIYAGDGTPRAAELQRDADRWEQVAAATLTLTDLDPQGEYGPDNDPSFPQRYFAAATRESLRLNALADAADEQASAVDERAAAYTAILAIIAVSLYLFGLTLAVGDRWLRSGFFGVGLLLLGVGAIWMAQVVLTPPYVTNDQAAAEYAEARVTWLTAHDAAGYQQAEAHYDQAIALRPTFARAYADRAAVIFDSASPQLSGYVSIAPPEALERARADLQQALALGLENPQTLGDLGFYGFAEGIQSGDLTLLNESADYSRRAIALDPGEPVYRYNLAVALVAAGRTDEARAAYDDAVDRTLYVDDALTQLRLSPGFEEAVLAGGLTDLETVRRYRPDLDDQIRAFKEQIVGRVASQQPDGPPPSPAQFSDIQLDVFPAEVQWVANIADYDAQRDTISVQWYHQDPEGLGWAVVPEISTADPPSQLTDGTYFKLSAYLNQVSPPACLSSGEYRVEIYINSRLAAEGTAAASFPDYRAFVARDLTTAFCRPADWARTVAGVPGLIDGFASADGQYGVHAARYALPGSLLALPDASAQMEDATMQSFSDWFPSAPTLAQGSETTTEYFEGLTDRAWRWYDYGTGYVRVGAGLTQDGAVVMGMVFGPYDWFEGDEPYRILNSMIHVE